MILYFSGVGNSAWAAQTLANQIDDELCDMGTYIKENRRARLHSDRPWVVVAPVHWWYLPNVVTIFLQEGLFSGCSDLYFIMTYAKDAGAPERKLRALCKKNHFTYRGLLSLPMPDHYLLRRKCPDEEAAAHIQLAAEPTLHEAGGCILERKNLPRCSPSLSGAAKSGIGNFWAVLLLVSSRFFYAAESCDGCEACLKRCPMNNITLFEEHPRWHDRCIHCMACVAACPHNAITQRRIPSRKERRQMRKEQRKARALETKLKKEARTPPSQEETP